MKNSLELFQNTGNVSDYLIYTNVSIMMKKCNSEDPNADRDQRSGYFREERG